MNEVIIEVALVEYAVIWVGFRTVGQLHGLPASVMGDMRQDDDQTVAAWFSYIQGNGFTILMNRCHP